MVGDCGMNLGYSDTAVRRIECMYCDIPIIKGQEYFRGYSDLGNSRGTKSFHYTCYLKLCREAIPYLEEKMASLEKRSGKI